jgi:hypothetical protein
MECITQVASMHHKQSVQGPNAYKDFFIKYSARWSHAGGGVAARQVRAKKSHNFTVRGKPSFAAGRVE